MKILQHHNNSSHLPTYSTFFSSLLSGGADTGFRHVTPEEYVPRLLHFRGKGKDVVVNQVGGKG